MPPLKDTPRFRRSARELAHDYVLTRAALSVYDPLQPRRPRVPVMAFEVELLEIDAEAGVIHAAGEVTLAAPGGEVRQFLRITLPVTSERGDCRLDERGHCRAVYVVDLGEDSGACKETAAFANV